MEINRRTLVRTVMTNSTKHPGRNVSSWARRAVVSLAKSAMRVPRIVGVAGLVVTGAKLIGAGGINLTRGLGGKGGEKAGVGTKFSGEGGPSGSMSSKEP
jgi:hypothetical protein